MAVDRGEIERALDELSSYEEWFRFQTLAVILAKQKWPDLIANEPHKDRGLDAYSPRILATDHEGKGLACSLTPTFEKIKGDATTFHANYPDISKYIFYTPRSISQETIQKWATKVRQELGYELIVVSREDIITSLLNPSNVGLCRSILKTPVSFDRATEGILDRVRDATRDEVRNWLSHPRLVGQPLISLKAGELDEEGKGTEEIHDLASIQDSLLNGRRIILEGPGGAGKTTTLIQLANQQIKESRLGFVIDFPAWIRSHQEILEFITRAPAFRSRSIGPGDLAALYMKDHFSFLLNGWNEISEIHSEDAVRALAELERTFPAAGIIIATRPHHIRPPLPGSFRLKLLPLNQAQRKEYLEQALADRAGEFISQIERDRALDELTRTPLILSGVTNLFNSGRSIPATQLGILSAVMQKLEDSDEHRDHLQRPPLSARVEDYLTDLAHEMTVQGHVDIPEGEACRIVSTTSQGLRDAGQIALVPEPASILHALCEHHVLERLEYQSVAFRFQHQRFQEFYSSLRLVFILGTLVADENPDRIRVFQAEYLNKPIWAEPLSMIAEGIGTGDIEFGDAVEAVTVGRCLVIWSIPVDPIFASELSRHCGSKVWREIQTPLGERLRRWYGVEDEHHKQCALAGMLATGSDDFCNIILPLLTDNDQQVRLRTYRALGEFYVSSLGADWRGLVAGWEEERRIEFLHEMTGKGGKEAVQVVESFAAVDPSQRVKVEGLRTLSWLGADESVEQILRDFDGVDFTAALRHDRIVEELPPSLHSRAIGAYQSVLSELTDVGERLRFLISIAVMGDLAVVEDLKEELGRMPSDRISDNLERLVKSASDLVRVTEPEWVSHWVAVRIANGMLWGKPWTDLITSVPSELASALLQRISAEELPHPDAQRTISVLAAINDPSFAAQVFSRLCALRARILESTREDSQVMWRIYRQLKELFRALSPELVISGISDSLSGEIVLVEFLVISERFGHIAFEESDIRSRVPNELRQELRAYLKNCVSFVSGQDDSRGQMKADLAIVLGSAGDPEDMVYLRRLIRSDIERVRRFREAWRRGDREARAAGAVMGQSGWHVRAVSELAPESADEVLLEVFNEPEYEIDAGWALTRLALRQGAEERFQHWKPDFRDVWEAREGNRQSVFDEDRRVRYANKIRTQLDVLIKQRRHAENPDSFNGRLKELVKMIAYLDGGNSASLVMEIVSLSGEWDGWTRVEALESLLQSGVVLFTDVTFEVLNPTIEHTLAQGIYNNQNSWLLKRCLCLLPFVDDPSRGIHRIGEILSQVNFPVHELRDIVTALGQSRSHDALTLLLELAGAPQGRSRVFAQEWIEAIANLGFPESKKVLVSFIEPTMTEPGIDLSNEYHIYELLASHIVALAREETGVKERIYRLCNTNLPPDKRTIISNAIAKLGTPEAILAGLNLIRDGASPPVPFDLNQAIETFLVERKPYGEAGYGYTLEPRSYNVIRGRLFEMVLNDGARRKTAFALLGEIEIWRLRYGKPSEEPRHPGIETGNPWPPLEVMEAI